MSDHQLTTHNNPRISALLRWVTALESTIVLACGFGLLFLYIGFTPLWPWPITPFNAAFMGAIYLSSAVAAVTLAIVPRWSPARVVVPMILLFTGVVLVVSLLYVDRLTRASPSTGLWYLLYIGIPLNSAYHLWLYRRWQSVDRRSLPVWYRRLVNMEIAVFTLYGVALLVAPAAFAGFWPWKVDDFHGRMYCVAFLTPALGAFLLRKQGSRLELMTLGLIHVVGGVLTILGFVLVDMVQKRVDWSAAGTWAWLAFFPLLVIVGSAMMLQGLQRRAVAYTGD